ncbi:MAG TPA: electron transport complex subunit RsxB [Pseudomonadales bacterium]|nr:electron transport complex subunit RsxB [Pseudomonadales bacterium]
MPLIEQIDAILPQTQCTKCGYQGCRPYAEAIANGDAINKCPPGGQDGINKLASLLQQPAIPLDTTHGEAPQQLLVAYIREAECIGCTKCIQACPVDAILGAAKLMHTVISDICTGCDLCVAPCPVDCIDMIPAQEQQPSPEQIQIKAGLSRQRFNTRNKRLQKLAEEKSARKKTRIAFHEVTATLDNDARNAVVMAALAAAREKSSQQSTEEQRAKLQLALTSARERYERADTKVKQAEKKGLGQLEQLKARREDMRFKLEETEKKLAALDKGSAATTAMSAVEKILTARSKKSDKDRIADGLAVIEGKLDSACNQLCRAEGEERVFLQEDIERLEKKRVQLLTEIREN